MEHEPGRRVVVECWCQFTELDKAIPSLFELPGVPIADGQIHRAVAQVRRMVDLDHAPYPLHFKAFFDRFEGSLIILQVVYGNRTPRTYARRNEAGAIEFLDPMWGVRGLPVLAQPSA